MSGFSPNRDKERRPEERVEVVVAVFSPFDQKFNDPAPMQMKCPSTFEAAELSCYILSYTQFRYPEHLLFVCEKVFKVLQEGSLRTDSRGCFSPQLSGTFPTGLRFQKHRSRAQQFLFRQIIDIFQLLESSSVGRGVLGHCRFPVCVSK